MITKRFCRIVTEKDFFLVARTEWGKISWSHIHLFSNSMMIVSEQLNCKVSVILLRFTNHLAHEALLLVGLQLYLEYVALGQEMTEDASNFRC